MNPNKAPLDLVAVYPAVADIKDARLRQGVIDVFEELWQESEWQSLADLPTSGEISSPNLPHTQCVVDMALAVADALVAHHGTKIDRDLLIAGSVLQDASKLVEYAPGPDGRAVRTAIGVNYMHGFWCAHLAALKNLPHELSQIILTHGSGSVKFPDSLEGKILAYVDQIDVIAIHGDRWKKTISISK